MSEPSTPMKAVLRPVTERQASSTMLEDSLNKNIVRMLRADGRVPFSEIAHKLDVSEGTIRNRVSAMKNAGVLMITAVTEVAATEYRTEAMLGVKVQSGHDLEATANRLGELDDVIYIAWVSGRYDLLVEVISSNDATLLSLLTEHVYGREDIASVEVMSGLKNFKNQFLLKSNWT